MQTEEKLIPYFPRDPTGKRVLVLAPHPDDETLGCGGSLFLHARAKDPVKVVFLTNGAKGDSTGSVEKTDYMALRQQEARKACACLGVTDLEFWPFEDRSLAGAHGALRRMIDLLEEYHPQLVYAPSSLEIHPDHRATCFLLCDALKRCHFHFEIAFYEVGQPLQVNALVDITDVLFAKKKAIEVYESQLMERPYGDITLGLNRFRSMTLPEKVSHAEGFSWQDSRWVQKIGPMALLSPAVNRLVPAPGEAGPLVSIIVRTKDRPQLLKNAIRSISAQTYANLEMVVVNDGGAPVRELVEELWGNIPLNYVHHDECLGRAAAANSGLKTAKGEYCNFLDDDDVLYPDHVAHLVNHLEMTREKVAYSNVLNVHFSGPPENPGNREREDHIFNFEYDPDRLLFENYIPLMSVLFSKEILDKVEPFSTDLDLFEDWDFWIRVSRHFPFLHLDQTTAEYRFYGNGDMASAHQEKYRYDEAKALVFDRTRPLMTGTAWAAHLKSAEKRAKAFNEEKAPMPDPAILTKRLDALEKNLERLSRVLSEQKGYLEDTREFLAEAWARKNGAAGKFGRVRAILKDAVHVCREKGLKRG